MDIYKRVMGQLIYLNHMKNKIPTYTRIPIVQTLALSIINYFSTIWSLTNKTQIKKAQKLQNFTARVVIANINKYDLTTNKYKQIKIVKRSTKMSMGIANMNKYDLTTPYINKLKLLKVQQKMTT